METLEKVVKALEICGKADPSFCPYFDIKHWGCCTGHIQGYSPVKDDAYSYLREYLNYQNMQKTVNKTDSLSDTENKPLDWEELKQMVGKPVWMEVYDPIDEKTGWHTASWKLIEFINDEYFDVRDSDGEQECFYKSENDCYCWQAYRKERI